MICFNFVIACWLYCFNVDVFVFGKKLFVYITCRIEIKFYLRSQYVRTSSNVGQCVGGRMASWPWSYGSWIYNCLCNQYQSPLMLWVRILIRARCTTLCKQVCQWLAIGWWFSTTNKTDRHNITEILLSDVKHHKPNQIFH
jgi:hypothetical protein